MSFRPCSECRALIELGAMYWNCSVSTCNRAHATLAFCTVNCWDAHTSTARHRDAYAVEQRAPRVAPVPNVAAAPTPPSSGPVRRLIDTGHDKSPATGADDILIVVSKMKKYIRDVSGMSCADGVADELSHHVRHICDEAIRTARRAERKTVLDRDVPTVSG